MAVVEGSVDGWPRVGGTIGHPVEQGTRVLHVVRASWKCKLQNMLLLEEEEEEGEEERTIHQLELT